MRDRQPFIVVVLFLFASGLFACGEASAEIEGTYDCTGERTVEENGAEEEESMQDTLVLTMRSESEVAIDSEFFGELTGTLTSGSSFYVHQTTHFPGLDLVGSVTLEAEGRVTGDTLTFTGSYEMPGLTATFSLTGTRRSNQPE